MYVLYLCIFYDWEMLWRYYVKPELLEFQNHIVMTNSSLMGRLSPSSSPLRVRKLLSPVLKQLITMFGMYIYNIL